MQATLRTALSVVVFCLGCADAGAKGPPKKGAPIPSCVYIMCDTREQLLDISRAGMADDMDVALELNSFVFESFIKWVRTTDEAGRHTCTSTARLPAMLAGKSKLLGIYFNLYGQEVNGWAVELLDDPNMRWVLYEEPVQQLHANKRVAAKE